MPRLFLGVELAEPLKRAALTAQQGYPAPRWQSASQLHLTLRFLGAVEAERLPALEHALRTVRVERFELAVAGVGCFGEPDAPKILWAGVTPHEPLQRLREQIDLSLLGCGLGYESSHYRPHITLARLRQPAASARAWLACHQSLSCDAVPVEEFCLVASRPAAEGSRYTCIQRFPLLSERG